MNLLQIVFSARRLLNFFICIIFFILFLFIFVILINVYQIDTNIGLTLEEAYEYAHHYANYILWQMYSRTYNSVYFALQEYPMPMPEHGAPNFRFIIRLHLAYNEALRHVGMRAEAAEMIIEQINAALTRIEDTAIMRDAANNCRSIYNVEENIVGEAFLDINQLNRDEVTTTIITLYGSQVLILLGIFLLSQHLQYLA
jgi:hypothetical protein